MSTATLERGSSFASVVVPVPYDHVNALIRAGSCLSIQLWGMAVVDLCLKENDLLEDVIGVERLILWKHDESSSTAADHGASTAASSPKGTTGPSDPAEPDQVAETAVKYRTVLREKLVRQEIAPHRSSWTWLSLPVRAQEKIHFPMQTNNSNEEGGEEEEGKRGPGKRSSQAPYVRCCPTNAPPLTTAADTDSAETVEPLRSPFPVPVHQLETTLALQPITSDPSSTFASFTSEFACLEADHCDLLSDFLSKKIHQPLLSSLTEVAMASYYQMDPKQEDLFHAQYRRFEAFGLSLDQGVDDNASGEEKLRKNLDFARLAFAELLAQWVTTARKLRTLQGVGEPIQESDSAPVIGNDPPSDGYA